MKNSPFRNIFKKGTRFYLMYALVFAVLLFAVKKPKKDLGLKELPNYNENKRKAKDRIELIESGRDGALVRLNLLANAQESIDITYFVFKEGISTDVIVGSLLEAADRGVEVRIILDGIFNNFKGDLKDSIYGFARHPNIKLKYYEPLKMLLPKTWNTRLHDKIIIVDKKLALIGGRNLGDRYFLEEREKESFSKDRDALIYKDESAQGLVSVVDDMANYFNKTWNYENSEDSLEKLSIKEERKGERFNKYAKYEYKKFKEKYPEHLKPTDWYKYTMAVDSIGLVYNPLGRGNTNPWCLRVLLDLSSKAKDSILLQSPYVIPSRSMKSEIRRFDIDFHRVRMLTNSIASSPNVLAIAGYSNNRKNIVDHVGDIYEYQGPDSLHGKTYIFDEKISVIGSFNFDARSSYLNTETMVIITSQPFASKLRENIQKDLDNSLKVDKTYSYIQDENVEEYKISFLKKITIKTLAKIVWSIEYLL